MTELATLASRYAPPSTTQSRYPLVNSRVHAASKHSRIRLDLGQPRERIRSGRLQGMVLGTAPDLDFVACGDEECCET